MTALVSLSASTVDRIRNGILQGGFPAVLEIRLDRVEPDYCRLRLPATKTTLNAVGILHGGAAAALLDTAATAAAWAKDGLGADARGTTVGFSINFLSFSRDADVIAEARVVRRGGSLVVIDVDISDSADRHIATGTVTYKLSAKPGPTSIGQP